MLPKTRFVIKTPPLDGFSIKFERSIRFSIENNRDETTALSRAQQSGDRAQIERILAEHREYLCRVVRARQDSRLSRRVDESDIVQEAQLEAFRRIEEYLRSPVVPVRIWLRKLVLERLLMAQRMHLRAQKRAVGRERHFDHPSAEIAQQLLATTDTPSRVASARETSERIRASLDLLPENDREIILMHLYEGLNSQESAAALGIEPAAARKRLSRALRRFRRLLDDQDLGASSL